MLLLLESGDSASVSHLDIVPRLKTWAATLGFQGILALKEGLDEAHRLQIRNVNQQLGLDSLAVGLASAARTGPHTGGD